MEPLIKSRLITLHDYILDVATKDPDKVAIIFNKRHYNYSEVIKNASALAAFFTNNTKVNKGDRIVIYTNNCAEHIFSVLGCLFAGVAFVPINTNIKKQKLDYILHDIKPVAIVSDTRDENIYKDVIGNIDTIKDIIIIDNKKLFSESNDKNHYNYEDIILDNSLTSINITLSDDDVASVIYTSGSSGFPKGVVLTHLNMLTAATSIISYLDLNQSDRIICCLPLSFDYGLYQYLMSLLLGATLILKDTFKFIGETLNTLEEEKCTVFPVIPTIISLLMTRGDLTNINTNSIRIITNTAAALELKHVKYIQSNFLHASIFSMYGLTECKRVSYLPPEDIDLRVDSIGKGMPNQELFQVDKDDNILPNGSVGELVISGNHIMRGYWNNPEETKKYLKTRDNSEKLYLYTGDIFRSDEAGYLYFAGRKDDMIKSQGEKVSPAEIEKILKSMPEINEAIVLGVDDSVAGTAVCLFVSIYPDIVCDKNKILRFCKTNLEPQMVPKIIYLVDAFPRNNNDKIDRQALRESHIT